MKEAVDRQAFPQTKCYNTEEVRQEVSKQKTNIPHERIRNLKHSSDLKG